LGLPESNQVAVQGTQRCGRVCYGIEGWGNSKEDAWLHGKQPQKL